MNTETRRELRLMPGVLAGVAEMAWGAAYSSAAGASALAVAVNVD